MARDLGLGTAGSAWVIDAYSLAFAAALLPAGFAADGLGRRRVLLLGLLVFGGASAACALAGSGPALWAWRAVQGLGSALLTCSALALLAGLHPRAEDRLWAFGKVGTPVGVAMIAGPAGGGALAAALGWQAIFWVKVPLCAGLFVACATCLREQTGQRAPLGALRRVALAVAAIVGLVWSLLEGPQRGWRAPVVWVPALLAVMALGALLPRLRAAGPNSPLHRGFRSACALAALQSIAYWATLVCLPLAAARWFHTEPAHIGLLMLAATVPMLLLPRWGARLAQRRGLAPVFVLGLGAITLGDLLLWQVARAPHFVGMLAAMLLAGSGAGLMNAQLSGAFAGLVRPEWAARASALGITMRQLGYALGVALLGAVAQAGSAAFAASFALAAAAGALGMAVAWRMPRPAAAPAPGLGSMPAPSR